MHAVYGLYLSSFLPLHTPGTKVDEYDGAGRGYRMGREIGLDATYVNDYESQKMVSMIDDRCESCAELLVVCAPIAI